jgi:cytoskeleton protein RodZ
MSAQEPGIGPQIGASLRDARRRLGLEVKEVEERTKIRARYIRALENEEWETLPGPAYIRGFLRTYGAMLGLDGETLADEYRRRHERSSPGNSSAAEPLLSERRSRGVGPPSRGPLIVIVVLAIAVALYILGQTGGDDEPESASEKTRTSAKQLERAERKAKKQMKQSEPENELTETEGSLRALTSVQVCLVSGNDALIDEQLISEGAEEQLSGEKVYRVDVSGGGVLFEVGDERRRVETTGRVSLEGDSRGIREIEPPGECP